MDTEIKVLSGKQNLCIDIDIDIAKGKEGETEKKHYLAFKI